MADENIFNLNTNGQPTKNFRLTLPDAIFIGNIINDALPFLKKDTPLQATGAPPSKFYSIISPAIL